jgi:hypothetical protein
MFNFTWLLTKLKMPRRQICKNPAGATAFCDYAETSNTPAWAAAQRSRQYNALMLTYQLLADRLQIEPSFRPVPLSTEHVETSDEDIASLRAETDRMLVELEGLEAKRVPLCHRAAPFCPHPVNSLMRPLIGFKVRAD